jgi:hypothetical protein
MKLITPLRWIICGLLLIGLQLIFAEKAVAAPATQSIDSGSIDNLGDGLLDEELARALTSPPSQPEPKLKPPSRPINPAGEDSPDWLPEPDLLRRMMEQEAAQAAGEDIGSSPLASVIQGMRRAEGLLADDSIEQPAVPVQRQVVAELEELIAKMEKQCKSCSKSKKPSDSNKQASKRSQPKPGQCDKPGSKSNSKPSKAARSSNTSFSSANSPGESTPPEELMKEAWGHLPERMREQMMQASSDEFLPEYREQLEAYFRRLAERQADDQR